LRRQPVLLGGLLQSAAPSNYISRRQANFDQKARQIRQMVEAIDREIEPSEARLNKKTGARGHRQNGTPKRITETGKRDPNRRK
jgi:hypothetical protein